MKILKAGILIAVVSFILSGCGMNPSTVSNEEQVSSMPAQLISSEPSSQENMEQGGPSDLCKEHCFSYHSIDANLLNYVGQDNFINWYESTGFQKDKFERADEWVSIQSFIEYFNIPKDVFQGLIHNGLTDSFLDTIDMTLEVYLIEYGYTDAQIDALYSGDQAQINEAFCGPLSYYNADDGQLYSIYWLAEHSAADYIEAGLPLDRVEEILTLAEDEASPVVQGLAADVQETLVSAMALEEERLSAEPSAESSEESAAEPSGESSEEPSGEPSSEPTAESSAE